ncbi:MAG: Hpt domain-containing protein [Gemmatimonadota bacterium]|nr:Hpt domain-containing protein [Gemmatimonadota bacterium]
MTVPTPVGFLDFFILEAGDYVEQLDGLLDAGGVSGPNPDELQRVARALRGSATMAKLPSFSEVAAGIEHVGRAMRETGLRWEPELSSVVVAAVDDAKLLLRQVRTWGDAENTRAKARVSELSRYGAPRGNTPMASASLQGHDSYLATEAANIAAGLELVATRPADRDAAANVLRRVRALRGIASIKDHPTLADVLEPAEQAALPLEANGTALSAERIALLTAAATVLRGVAAGIRSGAGQPPAADVARFATALDALHEQEIGVDRVLPIADLFFRDGGATVVESAANPPTTAAERFRRDVVGHGEHLRRLVADARSARDDLARDRVRRGLRLALRQLRDAAESYGDSQVAAVIDEQESAVVILDTGALDALDKFASVLASPGLTAVPVIDRLVALKAPAPRAATPAQPTPSVAPQAPTHSPPSLPPRLETPHQHVPAVSDLAGAMLNAALTQATSAASRLGDLLDAGIKNLGALNYTPLSVRTVVQEQPAVPIEALLYRGRAAIERCVEIREESRRTGGSLDPEAQAELFDLLDRALAG